MKHLITPAVLLLSFAACAADVGRVIVRQQWPWSTAIKVEFELKNVTDPVDVSLKAYNGTAQYDQELVDAATVGKRYALTQGGTHTLTLDPSVLFASGTKTVPDFKVTVTATTADKSTEVLYKIVNLQSPYDIEDVTRAQFLNGERGAYETEYSQINEEYKTELDDVLIWTGVTNNIAYKTTHMVLRKIPAKGKTFPFLKGATVMNYVDGVAVETKDGIPTTLTNDYYIGVFEVTQSQYTKVRAFPDGSAWETNALYAATRPADRMYYTAGMRGSTKGLLWPEGDHTDVDSNSFFSIMQNRYKLVFDLPTEAMWEFACRGGTETQLYTGCGRSADRLKLLARGRGINRPDNMQTCDRNADLSDGPNIVGGYHPNAWGLYDMLGNVRERCMDVHDPSYVFANPLVDPRGATNSALKNRVAKGGDYVTASPNLECHRREGVDRGDANKITGFRVCLYSDLGAIQ